MRLVSLLIALCIALPAMAAERYYVLLGANHPDYQPAQEQVVMSGFVPLQNLQEQYPEGQYSITATAPEQAVSYPQKSLNQKLEELFLSVLPSHLGQPYMTDMVIKDIMQAKVAIIEANNLNQPAFAKAILQALNLPEEMASDRQALIDVIDQHP